MEGFTQPICEQLRATAMALPEVTEGTSCVNRAFKVRGKTFMYLGEKPELIKLMVRLKPSLEAARELGGPRVEVGKIGWVTVRWGPGEELDVGLLEGWVRESFVALGPKGLVKGL